MLSNVVLLDIVLAQLWKPTEALVEPKNPARSVFKSPTPPPATTTPLTLNSSRLFELGASAYSILNGRVRIYRLPTGEWYKPDSFGRYTKIASSTYASLEEAIANGKLKKAHLPSK